MKRSRACADLVALETHHAPPTLHRKRNKRSDVCDLAFELSLRDDASIVLDDVRRMSVLFDLDAVDCFARPRDTRSLTVLEQDAREATEALAFKHTARKLSGASDCHLAALLSTSPDSPDAHILRDCFDATEAKPFDMSAFILVLDPTSPH
ncbi:hypothetical protein PINS_up008928 [Pythium insidiosum]|nr:hypothetical protein PINS_up008928 [Pythium insidiosum]